MTNTSLAELYFVAGMMLLILIMCVAATYIFVRQYRREHNKPDAGTAGRDDDAESK